MKREKGQIFRPTRDTPTHTLILNHTSSQISLSLLTDCPSSFTLKAQTQTHKSLHLSLPNLSSLLVSRLASKISVIKLFSMVCLLPT
ncbi:hypothetical protein ACB092_12G179400 [Castanea dentata]